MWISGGEDRASCRSLAERGRDSFLYSRRHAVASFLSGPLCLCYIWRIYFFRPLCLSHIWATLPLLFTWPFRRSSILAIQPPLSFSGEPRILTDVPVNVGVFAACDTPCDLARRSIFAARRARSFPPCFDLLRICEGGDESRQILLGGTNDVLVVLFGEDNYCRILIPVPHFDFNVCFCVVWGWGSGVG